MNTQSAAATKTPTEPNQVFIARQPILDTDCELFAYEFLFRDSEMNRVGQADGDSASYHTMNHMINLAGMHQLTAGKPAFINFTRNLLLERAYTLLPREKCVVELLEDVEPDREVLAACRELKSRGYHLALDDVISTLGMEALLEYADIVKVDFLLSDAAGRCRIERHCRAHDIELLAEKVEDYEVFQSARQAGYRYFQGYFFCKPQVLKHRDMKAGKLQSLRFLQEINRPELSLDQLEAVISQDNTLSYKLLRYINSAWLGLSQKVHSIHQALVLLGHEPLRRWGTLIAMTGLGDDKPGELLRQSLIRARFCELLGELLDRTDEAPSLFLMGMLSTLNAIIDQPMHEALEGLAVETTLRDTLLGRTTRWSSIYGAALSCERCREKACLRYASQLGQSVAALSDCYCRSAHWADQAMQICERA